MLLCQFVILTICYLEILLVLTHVSLWVGEKLTEKEIIKLFDL